MSGSKENMKSRLIKDCLGIASLVIQGFFIFGTSVSGQGTCSVKTFDVSNVRGKVVSQGRLEEPVSQTKVELFKFGGHEALVQSALTDEKGFFEMNNIKKGTYRLVTWFTVRGQTFLKYDVILNVKRSQEQKTDKSVLIKLSADCFTSDATVIKGGG
jgi:hypothetical protein